MRSWLIATQVDICSFVLIRTYQPEIRPNGDTLKQLLAKSRYLLFKHHIKWTAIQKHRAELLFERYPQLKKAYQISLNLGDIFKLCKSKEQAFKQLPLWYNVVEDCGIDAFQTVARSIRQITCRC